LLNHPCVDCGESNPIVLDFDHIDKTNKKSLTFLTRSMCSLKTLEKEINKCEVRCANCHRIKHASEIETYRYILNLERN